MVLLLGFDQSQQWLRAHGYSGFNAPSVIGSHSGDAVQAPDDAICSHSLAHHAASLVAQ